MSPAYFQTMGIELIKGRLFTAQETPATPSVAIIDEVLARRYFPNEDPLGQRLKASADAPGIEIVGIVRHAEPNSLDAQGPARRSSTSTSIRFLWSDCQALSGASIC